MRKLLELTEKETNIKLQLREMEHAEGTSYEGAIVVSIAETDKQPSVMILQPNQIAFIQKWFDNNPEAK